MIEYVYVCMYAWMPDTRLRIIYAVHSSEIAYENLDGSEIRPFIVDIITDTLNYATGIGICPIYHVTMCVASSGFALTVL